MPDRRWIKGVDYERDDNQADQARNDRCSQPGTPGNRNTLLFRKLRRKRVARHRGEKHRACRYRCLIRCHRHKACGLPRGRIAFWTKRSRERLKNRKDGAPGTRRVARNKWGEYKIRRREAIAETQRSVSQQRQKQIRDSWAEAGAYKGAG